MLRFYSLLAMISGWYWHDLPQAFSWRDWRRVWPTQRGWELVWLFFHIFSTCYDMFSVSMITTWWVARILQPPDRRKDSVLLLHDLKRSAGGEYWNWWCIMIGKVCLCPWDRRAVLEGLNGFSEPKLVLQVAAQSSQHFKCSQKASPSQVASHQPWT